MVHANVGSMGPKELKELINKAGLGHLDCIDISELQERARQAQDLLSRVGPKLRPARPFNLTNECQEVPPGVSLPAGCEVRMDLSSGDTFARIPRIARIPINAPNDAKINVDVDTLGTVGDVCRSLESRQDGVEPKENRRLLEVFGCIPPLNSIRIEDKNGAQVSMDTEIKDTNIFAKPFEYTFVCEPPRDQLPPNERERELEAR